MGVVKTKDYSQLQNESILCINDSDVILNLLYVCLIFC